jgi:GMP synthase (glutamine-hydrolysing)
MTVADEAVAGLNLAVENVILAQGTLRPDLIESASGMVSGKAAVIKTHHNDTHLVRRLRDEGRVVEPLKVATSSLFIYLYIFLIYFFLFIFDIYC